MASSITAASSPSLDGPDPATGRQAHVPTALGYAISAALVALAALAAFVVDHLVQAPNLSLVFVLPVIVAAMSFGWGPALVSAFLSVGVFDFLFIEPRYTFEVASPTDLWALALLLVVAAIVSTVAAESRRRALASDRAAAQATALHALAHAIIRAEPPRTLFRTAADTLGRIFNAPAVILTEQAGRLTLAASSRGAHLSAADQVAAQWAMENDKPTRTETYPFDQAGFDFWPVRTAANGRIVLGVKLTGGAEDRPAVPDRQVELIAGYLAAATAPGLGARRRKA